MTTAFAALLAVLALGATGYMLIEGWGFLDAVYMTIITLSTIGYGETHPLSDGGRIFTIALILCGIGVAAYAFSMMNALVVGGRLTNALRRKRMQAEIKKLENHYIICGGGRAAQTIGAELSRIGRPFVVLEKADEPCRRMEERGWLVLQGDATEDRLLAQAGLPKASGLFLCLPNDKDNTYLALSAKITARKDLRIVAAQVAEEAGTKLLHSGADALVNFGYISGMRMASEMVRPATTGFLDSMLRDARSDYRFEDVEIKAAEGFLLSDLMTGGDQQWPVIVAVKTAEKGYEVNPEGSRRVLPGQTLVVLGSQAQAANLRRKVSA